jgi:hypothetical protein
MISVEKYRTMGMICAKDLLEQINAAPNPTTKVAVLASGLRGFHEAVDGENALDDAPTFEVSEPVIETSEVLEEVDGDSEEVPEEVAEAIEEAADALEEVKD